MSRWKVYDWDGDLVAKNVKAKTEVGAVGKAMIEVGCEAELTPTFADEIKEIVEDNDMYVSDDFIQGVVKYVRAQRKDAAANGLTR